MNQRKGLAACQSNFRSGFLFSVVLPSFVSCSFLSPFFSAFSFVLRFVCLALLALSFLHLSLLLVLEILCVLQSLVGNGPLQIL